MISNLRRICSDQKFSIEVRESELRPSYWQVHSGSLVNINSDYFGVSAIVESGTRRLILEQKDEALVLLVVLNNSGERRLVLNVRSEPGLIGLTNLTTTIQSTKSNYLREHGGKPTPFLEVAVDPLAFGSVLHDSHQWDWGTYYTGKQKRFLIVEISDTVDIPENFVVVDEEASIGLLGADDLITNDLRASLSLLISYRRGVREANSLMSREIDVKNEMSSIRRIPISELETNSERGSCYLWRDDIGNTVRFFDIQAVSREVAEWSQPLLCPKSEENITLYLAEEDGGVVFGLVEEFMLGNPAQMVLTCADFSSDTVDLASNNLHQKIIKRVQTSAEGGRFFQHRVNVDVRTVGQKRELDNLGRLVHWRTAEEVETMISTSLMTSLELRLVYALTH